MNDERLIEDVAAACAAWIAAGGTAEVREERLRRVVDAEADNPDIGLADLLRRVSVEALLAGRAPVPADQVNRLMESETLRRRLPFQVMETVATSAVF